MRRRLKDLGASGYCGGRRVFQLKKLSKSRAGRISNKYAERNSDFGGGGSLK